MSKPISNKFQIPDRTASKAHLVAAVAAIPAVERVYSFGPFELNTSERTLTRSGLPVPVTNKSFDILLLLIENGGRLVTKDRLMEAIWPDTFVEEKTLAQNIFTLRKLLGTDASGAQFIETVPKYGYRFRAGLKTIEIPEGADGEMDSRSALNKLPRTQTAGESVPTPADGLSPTFGIFHSRQDVAIRLAALILGVGLVLAGAFLFGRGGLAKRALQKIDLVRLTNSGNVTAVALSPDGRFVAYAAIHGEDESLFVRQIEPGTLLEVVPAAPVSFRGMTFMPDGRWIYYVTTKPDGHTGLLFRVSLLGGAPQPVLTQSVDSRISFSPDGKQFAFLRWSDRTHNALYVANTDGSGERQLALSGTNPPFATAGPAWSPDGRTIVSATQNPGNGQGSANLVAIDAGRGTAKPLPAGDWNWIGQVAWLADGTGFIFTAWNPESETMSDQIWLMTYPGGERRRITSDINGYLGVDVSADGRLIVASESRPAMSFWVAPGGDTAQARRLNSGAGELYSDRLGLAWAPDGRIVYGSRQGGNVDLWMMAADGGPPHQLTATPGADYQPVISPDGKFVVFVSGRGGADQLWRIDADGGHPLQLAPTQGVRSPSLARDVQWVVFEGNVPADPTIWRVPVGGGQPVQVSPDRAFLPTLSPDGKTIACLKPTGDPGKVKLTLLAFADGSVVKQFDALVPRNTPALRWAPDGRAVTYVVTGARVSNIWSQPLDGGEPKPVTSWTTDRIFRFDWSRDGRLVAERGTTLTDVILIRGNEQ